ncbi:hypothetical protein Trco_006780 [Trichoderma cornu-damae]|uniref:Uncharacterized protein n=1 Tax=Trichoderma cornu-damae TaxID=654480 RepID=A0A9P8QL77_9HYPO|nr:hypothetical protein Trco_006780 [Trichoderma cornu-damae]
MVRETFNGQTSVSKTALKGLTGSNRPDISMGEQDSILELLCNVGLLINVIQSLLSPIGQHRRMHIKPSRGKRAAKREKRAKAKADEVGASAKISAPPSPELRASVDVGFNSITKNLGSLSKSSEGVEQPHKDYSMIFVARGSQSSAFNHHFPQMVAAASRNLPEKEQIRLVGFSKPCSERLGSVLGIPRVSSIAISRDAPGAEALLAVVENIVAPVASPWLNEASIAAYKATQIVSVETTMGAKRLK